MAESKYAGVSLLTIEQVQNRIQRGKSWIYEAERAGRFPTALRFSIRCTRWKSSDVDRWLQEQCERAGAK